MSVMIASIVRVPPTEAAERLRHLLYDRYIGVVMATKAIHPLGERILEEPTPVAFYREEEDTYLGSFLAGLGTIDLRFPKCNCRMLTECEVTALALGKLKSWGQLP